MKAIRALLVIAIATLAVSGSATARFTDGSFAKEIDAGAVGGAASPAGTWHTGEISEADAEKTLRRYGLARWIKRFRRETWFTEPAALILVIRTGDWDLYAKPRGKPRFAIDYDAAWRVKGHTVDKIHSTGVTTLGWSVRGDVLTLRWLGTTEPAYAGIPDEVYQRVLYMTRRFSRGPLR